MQYLTKWQILISQNKASILQSGADLPTINLSGPSGIGFCLAGSIAVGYLITAGSIDSVWLDTLGDLLVAII
jgi:hypothetical protein